MKILVLTNLFPTRWDPLRAAFNKQYFEWLARKHEVEVLVAVDFRDWRKGPRGNPESSALRIGHFVFWHVPLIGRPLHAVFWLLSLLLQKGRLLRRGNYDCILASWAFPDAVAAGWLARMLGIPFAAKLLGSDINVIAERPAQRVQIGAMLRKADATIAVSNALADKAVALGAPRARVHTIYNGVDAERFAPGPRQEARRHLSLPVDGKIVLYVGNLKAAKGCMDLLEALPAVLERHADTRLYFVGTGELAGALRERIAELGLAGRVTLVGGVSHAEVGDWMRAADVFSLPSHNEGVPNVVMEAMACGIPAVATRVGGIPEVLAAYAGILVEPRASAELSAALVTALEREWDVARIIAHARGFRWTSTIEQLDRILTDIVSRRRNAAR